jgi:hypothetical protein
VTSLVKLGRAVYSITAGDFQMYTFRNGILRVSSTPHVVFQHPLGQFRLGGRDNNCTLGAYSGELPVFRLYNRAFNADEVLRNFQAQASRFNLAP